MRKFNAVLSMGILVLFLIHAIAGGFQLAGILSGGSAVMQILAWVMLGMILIHVIIGCKLTVDTLKACKQSGTSYYKENKKKYCLVSIINRFLLLLKNSNILFVVG